MSDTCVCVCVCACSLLSSQAADCMSDDRVRVHAACYQAKLLIARLTIVCVCVQPAGRWLLCLSQGPA